MLLKVQKFRAFLEENMFNKKSSGRLDFISKRRFFIACGMRVVYDIFR